MMNRLGGRMKTGTEPTPLEDDLQRAAQDLATVTAELEDARSLLEVRSAALGAATERAEKLERENVALTRRNEELELAALPSFAEICEREPDTAPAPEHPGLNWLTLPERVPVSA